MIRRALMGGSCADIIEDRTGWCKMQTPLAGLFFLLYVIDWRVNYRQWRTRDPMLPSSHHSHAADMKTLQCIHSSAASALTNAVSPTAAPRHWRSLPLNELLAMARLFKFFIALTSVLLLVEFVAVVDPPELLPAPAPEKAPKIWRGERESSGGLKGGQKVEIALGVIACVAVLGFICLVYKKWQGNIQRSRYGCSPWENKKSPCSLILVSCRSVH
ncbi:hypothetical protein CK203_023347 [Vitis vinifera]|uniref:Uncharacterized protein n=1 Tax=Vitis vinifera TaxID=29760 RepID=A0A438J6J7_VITVI|nr:hypothetical protein CK203_023347 [Vitis vinifera]